MASLSQLLDLIPSCEACGLMRENLRRNIPYVPILPKPAARFMFIGRDPSPRTATVVGDRGGKSVFINEIFRLVDDAGVPEDLIYITDLCKCHWRTSAGGKAIARTENRSRILDTAIATTCFNKWLSAEIAVVKPKLIVLFGEELYQFFRPFITQPDPAPKRFSARADKSILDAEYWFVKNGPLTLSIGDRPWPAAVLRHAGNLARLSRSSDIDTRRQFYDKAAKQVVDLLII